ncbi:MAG: dienelactone hydrolase family protein [Planctomycetaceae bacterium]|jgi:predicted peptidase|nr:dienelactone hydrolase family protein [Planctomycetaceae bacterium]
MSTEIINTEIKEQKLSSKKNHRLLFTLFWVIVFLIFAGRFFYDLKVYFWGDVLVYSSERYGGYDYLLHLPRGYTDFGGARPLLIYLHGAGEVGTNVRTIKKHNPVHYINGKIPPKDFPFIVVSPITPIHGWKPSQVIKLLDKIQNDNGKRWKIDPARIYLTGMSMGGFGTFATACEYPERFAAIIPVAGGGDPKKADKLINLPTWAFHGNADDVVNYNCTADMIKEMNKIGCKEVKFTTLEGAGHGIAQTVYRNPKPYQWLNQQKNYSQESKRR